MRFDMVDEWVAGRNVISALRPKDKVRVRLLGFGIASPQPQKAQTAVSRPDSRARAVLVALIVAYTVDPSTSI